MTRALLVLVAVATLLACASDRAPPKMDRGGIGMKHGTVVMQTMDNGIGMQLVAIPGSFFYMGKPGEEHRVEVAKFYLGAREVTQREFARFVSATGYVTLAEHQDNPGAKIWSAEKHDWEWSKTATYKNVFAGDDRPVVAVAWDDAVAFTRWLTERERQAGTLPEGLAYRLPTEAEWEYAARAKDTYRYAGTDSEDDLCTFANVPDASAKKADLGRPTLGCDDGVGIGTAPAGHYQPNRWGLFDMTGNVYEWTSDCWDATCAERIMRGGSWSGDLEQLRVTARAHFEPTLRGGAIGFRVALGRVEK